MVEIETTKMSSKGQIVIPSNFRKHIKEGDTLLVMKNKDQIIIKLASAMDKQMAEDLEFARRTEEAYKRIEAGQGRRMDFDNFIEEMKKW
jgi:AbrB family looped-hinge helix DNA binding protein